MLTSSNLNNSGFYVVGRVISSTIPQPMDYLPFIQPVKHLMTGIVVESSSDYVSLRKWVTQPCRKNRHLLPSQNLIQAGILFYYFTAHFVSGSASWMMRGAHFSYVDQCGITAFHRMSAEEDAWRGSRVVVRNVSKQWENE